MPRPLHPLHAIFLAGALSLFLGALLGDLAYALSYEPQWKNFASWLMVGGLTLNAIATVWAAVDLVRLKGDRRTRRAVYLALTLLVCLLGLANSFVHAGDAWQGMPAGLILSALVVTLSTASTWLGFSDYRSVVRT